MGKWTLEYHDEVLRNKVKGLVQGAIKRMKVEQDAHTITYEAFVAELDEGDSFTTSLIDVLVKELAERRTRPHPSDRRLISERTAKSLRMQAAPLHVYRGGHSTHRPRRHIPLPRARHYSSFHDALSESEGDEEYGTVLGSSGQVEGAQINTDLYDAYLPSSYEPPSFVPPSADREGVSPPPPESQSTGSWILHNPPLPSSSFNLGTWTGLGGPGSSSLARQSTIRRPHRSRTMDSNEFSAFTTRRRSIIRGLTTGSADDDRGTDLTEPPARSSSVEVTRPTDISDGIANRSLDFSAWMARRRAGAPASAPASALSDTQRPSSSQLWYSMAASSSTSPEPMSIAALSRRSSSSDLNDDRRQVIAPRLRRGGLRPPESLLLQGPVSPAVEGPPFHGAAAPLPREAPQDGPSAEAVLPSHTEDEDSQSHPVSVSRLSPAVETR